MASLAADGKFKGGGGGKFVLNDCTGRLREWVEYRVYVQSHASRFLVVDGRRVVTIIMMSFSTFVRIL